MSVVHRLTGYDSKTERLVIEHDIPASKLKHTKELALIPHEDTDAFGSYQHDANQAKHIAALVSKRIDVDLCSWFLEPFDENGLKEMAA